MQINNSNSYEYECSVDRQEDYIHAIAHVDLLGQIELMKSVRRCHMSMTVMCV